MSKVGPLKHKWFLFLIQEFKNGDDVLLLISL